MVQQFCTLSNRLITPVCFDYVYYDQPDCRLHFPSDRNEHIEAVAQTRQKPKTHPISWYSRMARAISTVFVLSPEWGYYVHGILDDNKPVGESYRNVDVIGNTRQLADLLAYQQVR